MMTTRAAGEQRKWELPAACATTVFVGNFGSGKTETALNYAIALAARGEPVKLLDLDIVNPYFRSREARDYAGSRGVEVVAPIDEYELADLPILLRQVGGAIGSRRDRLVLDVGGDDLGARVLGGFSHALGEAAVLLVLNERRPFTDSLAGARRMVEALEAASHLKISGIVANTHLIDETTVEIIGRGVELAEKLSAEMEIPLAFLVVEKKLAGQLTAELQYPVLTIERLMTSPWEPSHRGPIGRPPSLRLPAGVE